MLQRCQEVRGAAIPVVEGIFRRTILVLMVLGRPVLRTVIHPRATVGRAGWTCLLLLRPHTVHVICAVGGLVHQRRNHRASHKRHEPQRGQGAAFFGVWIGTGLHCSGRTPPARCFPAAGR
jgi:hypothetical protein